MPCGGTRAQTFDFWSSWGAAESFGHLGRLGKVNVCGRNSGIDFQNGNQEENGYLQRDRLPNAWTAGFGAEGTDEAAAAGQGTVSADDPGQSRGRATSVAAPLSAGGEWWRRSGTDAAGDVVMIATPYALPQRRRAHRFCNGSLTGWFSGGERSERVEWSCVTPLPDHSFPREPG